jgi:phosphoribosylglycinamide formyltransferase-1
MTKLAVFVSGTGSILEAILADGLEVSLVVADRPCRGLDIAAAAGVATELVKRGGFGASFDRLAYTQEIVKVLEAHDISLIAMAGFMTILEAPIFDRYPGRILNTHPSLLPAFRGEHAVRDALTAGVKITGFTIHVATLELDAGPILAQAAVSVEEGDTVATLQERIKVAERKIYPETIRKLMTKASRP